METFIPSLKKLNIAQIWYATRALGPGLRSVIWVQGCIRHCPGCISPEWIPNVKANIFSIDELATILLHNSSIEGITFSGGEPMLQAEGLASLIRIIRKKRDLNTLCFTGYTYKQLLCEPKDSPVHKLLAELDVLIDGPYIAELNNNRGLRGSSNQNIYYLTERLKQYDLENEARHVELHIQNGYSLMVGVPPKGILNMLDQIITKGGITK